MPLFFLLSESEYPLTLQHVRVKLCKLCTSNTSMFAYRFSIVRLLIPGLRPPSLPLPHAEITVFPQVNAADKLHQR